MLLEERRLRSRKSGSETPTDFVGVALDAEEGVITLADIEDSKEL